MEASVESTLRSLLPPVATTAAKDFRAWWGMARFDRAIRRRGLAAPPLFVWQHHDLFQHAGFTLARRYGCPLMLFVDAPVVWEASKWGVARPVWGGLVEMLGESKYFREADLVACVSEEVAEAVVARGAVRERVVVTPCSAPLVRYAQPRRDIRKELGIEDHVVIGWVGSFRPFHSADTIVRAVAALERTEKTALLMVGAGATLAECRRLAVELGVRPALFPGVVDHEGVVDYLEAIDIAVIPSDAGVAFHYSPLKLKEYLARGRAVVVPSMGEMARTLRSGHDALLYPAGDQSAMVAAIARLIDDEDLRRTLQKRARETYDRLFSMEPQLDLITERLRLG